MFSLTGESLHWIPPQSFPECTKSITCDRQVWFLLNKQGNSVVCIQCLTLDRIQTHNSYKPLWEKKGWNLNVYAKPVSVVCGHANCPDPERWDVCVRTRPVRQPVFVKNMFLQGFCNGVTTEFLRFFVSVWPNLPVQEPPVLSPCCCM